MEAVKIQKIQIGRKGMPFNLSWVNFDQVSALMKHHVHEREIVIIDPGGYGGNHAHPRTETWLALGGELVLHYKTKDGQVNQLILNPTAGVPLLVTIPSGVPHAVTNDSSHPSILFEWSDGPLAQVKTVEVTKR